MLVFCLSALILFTQCVASSFGEHIEDPVIDAFDVAMNRHGEKIKGKSSDKQLTDGWIDPFDMAYYSHQEKRMIRDTFIQSEEPNLNLEINKDSKDMIESHRCQSVVSKMESNFLMRFVNMLINQCESGKEDFYQETTLILKITQGQLHDLRRLRESGESEGIIRLLNGITSRMTTDDNQNWWEDLLPSEEIWSNIGVAGFAFIPLGIFILYGTMRKVVCILALAVFAVGYFKTYKLMLQKVQVQNEHTLSKNYACNRHERSWFQMLFGSYTDEECLKQLHAMNVDPALEVTPVHVISHMLAVGSFQPIEHFGIVISRLSKQIFESHSFLYGWAVFLITVFAVLYIITLCFSGIFGRNLSVGNKHISLGITGTSHPESRGICTATEKTCDHQVVKRQQSEISDVKHEYSQRPVIQIIHNYSSHMTEKSAVQNEHTVKKPVHEEREVSSTDIKSIKDREQPEKIEAKELPHNVLKTLGGEDFDKILEIVKGNEPLETCEVLKGNESIKTHEAIKPEEAHKIHVIVNEKSVPEQEIMQKKQADS